MKTQWEVGKVFGQLKLLEEIPQLRGNNGRVARMFRLECSCGNIVEKQISSLKAGLISCGCAPRLPAGRLPTVKVGDVFTVKSGLSVYIVEYNGSTNIIAEFREPVSYQFKTKLSSLLAGSIKNKYYPSVGGIGYIGVGRHSVSSSPKAHKVFAAMISRCYDGVHPAYDNCTVAKEWHNFQNFAKWFYEQKGQDEKGWHLDKDILIKGNKEYGPEACCFVPQEINSLFVKRDTLRGEFPVGVSKGKYGKLKYRSSCGDVRAKRFWNGPNRETPEEAFVDYKKYKEVVIKQRADLYKDKIDTRVYEAMYNYQVEITD